MSWCADVAQLLCFLLSLWLQLGREAGRAGLRIQGSIALSGAGWGYWAAPFPLDGRPPGPSGPPCRPTPGGFSPLPRHTPCGR